MTARTLVRPISSPTFRLRHCVWLLALGTLFSGCSWLESLKQEEPNPSFPAWSQRMSGSVSEPQEKNAKQDPKSNSLFFDKRSQEIEKSLDR